MSALHGQMEKGFIGQAVVTLNRAGSNIMCQIAAQKVLHIHLKPEIPHLICVKLEF